MSNSATWEGRRTGLTSWTAFCPGRDYVQGTLCRLSGVALALAMRHGQLYPYVRVYGRRKGDDHPYQRHTGVYMVA